MFRKIINKFRIIYFKKPNNYHTKPKEFNMNREYCLNNPNAMEYAKVHKEYMLKYSLDKKYWEDVYNFIE